MVPHCPQFKYCKVKNVLFVGWSPILNQTASSHKAQNQTSTFTLDWMYALQHDAFCHKSQLWRWTPPLLFLHNIRHVWSFLHACDIFYDFVNNGIILYFLTSILLFSAAFALKLRVANPKRKIVPQSGKTIQLFCICITMACCFKIKPTDFEILSYAMLIAFTNVTTINPVGRSSKTSLLLSLCSFSLHLRYVILKENNSCLWFSHVFKKHP